MPASGARSGTAPSRLERGAGSGRLTSPLTLACGHGVPSDLAPAAVFAGGRKLYRCPKGCGLEEPVR
ncbi:MAG TPA: hypothetical protein VM204_09210 [Gaiellaceae bacterium]|nr:hypothetical protein [Gaiellaceae bacterium]